MHSPIKNHNNTKKSPAPSDKLPVMEQFYTIQGEGLFNGQAAYFIRLAGCDVGCIWCDVKESWETSDHPLIPISTLQEKTSKNKGDIVVITGGEPLMHDLDTLTTALRSIRKHTHIETSGAHPMSGDWDWICLSPKKFKAPLPDIYSKTNELKVIVYNIHDLDWAEEHAAKVSKDCKLFLQPEWSVARKMMPLIIDYIKKDPKWTVSLQTHKYMNIP